MSKGKNELWRLLKEARDVAGHIGYHRIEETLELLLEILSNRKDS